MEETGEEEVEGFWKELPWILSQQFLEVSKQNVQCAVERNFQSADLVPHFISVVWVYTTAVGCSFFLLICYA